MSLGTYPHIPLDQARFLRDPYLALLAKRIGPQQHNAEKANALKVATECTLQVVAKKWLEEKTFRDHARQCRGYLRSLERNLFPGLGNVPTKEIRLKLLKQNLA